MAAFGGHIQVMKKLLLRGADPNAMANDIGPVVNAAISSGSREAVELLVEHNVSLTIDSDNEDVSCPLALAALLADYSMFEYLIESYADKLTTDDYSAALVGAAAAGRIEVFNKLLNFSHDTPIFQSALSAAVEEWNWDIAKSLLEKCQGLDVNDLFTEVATCSEPQDKMLELTWEYANGAITEETLSNALYHATDREKTTTVRLLLQKFGANPNATGDEYGTALTAAAFDGIMEMVQLLLDAGANINDPNGWALQTAAAEGHYDIVQELINRGADVNACIHNANFEAGTALQGACESGRSDLVSLLLEKGANPNAGLGTDSPPIIAASQRGEARILEMLINAKADVDVFGGHDLSTPLINAAAYLPKESLQLLLNAGADINLPDNDGDTALIVATARGDVEAVTFLLDNGADIMHHNKGDMNALQTAFAVAQQADNEEPTEFFGPSNGQWECLNVLVERITVLLNALKTAVDSGNVALESIIRTANTSNQGLVYEDNVKKEPEIPGSSDGTMDSNGIDANTAKHELSAHQIPKGEAASATEDVAETVMMIPEALKSPDIEAPIASKTAYDHFTSQNSQIMPLARDDYNVSSSHQASNSWPVHESTDFVSKRQSVVKTQDVNTGPVPVPAPLEVIRRKPAPQIISRGDSGVHFQPREQQTTEFPTIGFQTMQTMPKAGADDSQHQPYLPTSQSSSISQRTGQFAPYSGQSIPQPYRQYHNMALYNNSNSDAVQNQSTKRYSAYDGSGAVRYTGYNSHNAQPQLHQPASDKEQQSYQGHPYPNYYGQQ